MGDLNVITVHAAGQTAHARVLADSLLAAHPGAELIRFDVEDGPTTADATTEHVLRMICSTGPELARALVPHVLLAETAAHPGVVVYLSPTTWIGDELAPLAEPAPDGGLRLVPSRHASGAPPVGTPRAGHLASCLAVSREAGPLLRWWGRRELDRLLGLPTADPLDETAATFRHDDLHHPGVGINAWNATERSIAEAAGRMTADDRPLVTFDFEGFDPHRPYLAIGDAVGRLPVRLSEHAVLRRLHASYARVLIAAGHDEATARPYRWRRLPGGLALDRAIRAAYRDACREARLGRGAPPPDPFVPGGFEAFVGFLNEPAPAASGMYSRYVWSLYETWPGLRSVFGDILAAGRRHFVDWLQRYARADAPIASVIELPTNPPPVSAAPARSGGVNVAGYLSADLGLGVAARRTIAALTASDVPTHPVVYRRTMSRQALEADAGAPTAPFDVNLVCVTAEQFPFFRSDMGPAFFAGHYTIGYWFWELEAFPDEQTGALDLVDEVWVATRHVLDSIAPRTAKPVLHMPIPLLEPHPSSRPRSSFGLGSGYTFLFAFDFHSVMERKNPLGLVDTFARAFPDGSGPQLVIKTINAEHWPADAELIRCAIAERSDITLYDGYLTDADQAALVAAADCYVSLHRAEGLGLTLADAMALGKPVVATAYSGNLDFMNDANSFLVPFRYTTVPPGVPVYPAGAHWADPDLDHAAELMQRLAADAELGQKMGAQARRDILQHWTAGAVGARMHSRLEEVWSNGGLPRP